MNEYLAAVDPERPLLVFFWPLVGADCRESIEVFKTHGLEVQIDNTARPQRRFATVAEQKKFTAIYDEQGYPDTAAARENVCVYRIKAIRS